MAEDESVAVVGHRWSSGGFLAAKLDADGDLLWQWEVRHFPVVESRGSRRCGLHTRYNTTVS